MEKNKSIDGLVPRRSKKAASPVKSPRPSAKSTTKSSAKSSTKPTSKSSKPRASRTASSRPATSIPAQQPEPISTTQDPSPDTHVDSSETTLGTVSDPAPTTHSPVSTAKDFLSPTQVFDFDSDSGELKTASPTPTTTHSDTTPTKKHKKRQKKPMSKKRKITIWIISIILLLLIGGIVWFIIWGNDIIAKITGGQGNVFDLITETYTPLKTDENGRTNILAFGTSGYNMEGDEGEGTHDGAQLTDSIMVISLDQDTGDTAMLSIPRDLKASPTCTATGKINEVYWCANMDGTNEQAGADALVAEVSDILDIDIQYYAHVNWGSLVQIVDTLGGITVTVDEDIYDYYVYEAGGTYTMGGEEALWLARIRHGTAHGDFTRSASQQKILIGIKDKIFEKSLSIADLLSLASTLGDNLRTNFSIDEMKTLAHLSSSFDFNTMRQVSLIEPEQLVTTGTIGGISYVLPSAGTGNYYAIQDYVAKMFSSDPRSYEDYTILVMNATDTPGLASTEKSTLESEGYDNIYVDDAPAADFATGYTLYTLTDTAPGTQKLLEEKYATTVQPIDPALGLPTDYDFIIIVNTDSATSADTSSY